MWRRCVAALSLSLCGLWVNAASIDNIEVLGTVTGPNKKSHYAIIIVDKGEPSNYKTGETVVPGYVLYKIFDDKITLKYGSKTVDIKIGVPFSAEDFNVESGLPPSYPESSPVPQAPIDTPPPAPAPEPEPSPEPALPPDNMEDSPPG